MPDEVTLDVTTIEENVTVETTAGDVVEIQVVAPTGPTGATGPAGPNSVTSATTSDGTANLTLNNVSTASFTAGNSSTTSGEITIFTNGPVFQWRSDTVEYGERGFTFLTTDITSEVNYTLPNASGTIALTTSNVATATALQNSRNIFGIAFDGTANVTGDATSNGHFASIPAGGQAGHFVTLNGTAPTVVAGRSAWWSDGSGNPSFRNGTGTAVTLVKSSDLGTNVANFLEFPTSANLASALTDENGTGGGFVRAEGATLTSPSLVGPVNLTSQDASTADRVMTRSLADTRYGQSLTSYLSADGPTVNNSTTLTNTGLELSLTVGLWYVDATLFFRNTTNAAGGKAKVVVASGSATNARGTAAIGNQVVNRIASISYLLTERSTTNPIATDGIFWATGILNVTADCVIRVQYAQGAAQATDSNSLAGSYLIAQKIN